MIKTGRKPVHFDQNHIGNPHTTSAIAKTAFLIVRKFGGFVPSIEQLVSDFSMSKATAYRWRNAMLESGFTERGAA